MNRVSTRYITRKKGMSNGYYAHYRGIIGNDMEGRVESLENKLGTIPESSSVEIGLNYEIGVNPVGKNYY